jgi:hypothetical protein
MTPQPATAARLPPNPTITDATFAAIFGTQPPDGDGSAAQHQAHQEAGDELIAALRPRDPLETAYATRAAAAHYGSVECLRRAMLPDVPENTAIRWAGKALALSRMNTEMVRQVRQCQAETTHPQPTAQAAAVPSTTTQPTTPAPATSAGRQDPMPSERVPSDRMPSDRMSQPPPFAPPAQPATPTAAKPAGRQDPMPSERMCEQPPFTPPAQPATAQATAIPPSTFASAKSAARQDKLSGRRRPLAPPAASATARSDAALAAKPIGTQHPVPGERIDHRPSFVPSTCILSTQADATSFLSAPSPRQSRRTGLLSSIADVAALLAAANVQARPHAL